MIAGSLFRKFSVVNNDVMRSLTGPKDIQWAVSWWSIDENIRLECRNGRNITPFAYILRESITIVSHQCQREMVKCQERCCDTTKWKRKITHSYIPSENLFIVMFMLYSTLIQKEILWIACKVFFENIIHTM